MKHWLLSVLLVVWCRFSTSNTSKRWKSNARIIVQDKMPDTKTSAQLATFSLSYFESKLPIENDKTPRKGDILIGGQTPANSDGRWFLYLYKMVFKNIRKEKGVVYGVVTLLQTISGN